MALRLKSISEKVAGRVRQYTSIIIDITKTFSVLELKGGTVYIETVSIDDEDTETVEILRQIHGKNFKIISRSRSGSNFNSHKPYDRDVKYPIHSIVRV